MFPNKLVEAMFRAYCAERKMNPEDWPIIGEEKQRAWVAAGEAAQKHVVGEMRSIGYFDEEVAAHALKDLRGDH